jgi:hypothetical protein
MHRTSAVTAMLAACTLLLTACAPMEERDDTVESAPIGTDSVRIDQVRDFRVLDRSNLILYAPSPRHAYHVELLPPCQGLRFADTIALRGRMGRLAGFAGDRVIIPGPGFPERCSIRSVRRLDEAALAELIQRFDEEYDRDPAAEEAEVEIPRREEDD